MKPPRLLPLSPARFVVMMFFVQISGWTPSNAQRGPSTLGAVTDIRSGKDARGLIFGDFNGDGIADLGTFGLNEVVLQLKERNGRGWRSVEIPTQVEHPIIGVVTGRFDRDRSDEICVFTDHPPELSIYSITKKNLFKPVLQAPVGELVEQAICGDINSDGIPDIILYGKKELGIRVLRGTGKGGFRPDSLMFPEFSVNEVVIADINGDGLNDLILSNWISNEVLVYTAFGKMKFGDPSVLRLEGEAQSIATAQINGEVKLALLSGGGLSCRLYAGTGLGQFRLTQSIDLRDPAISLNLQDFNGDGIPELCILSTATSAVSVYVDDGTGTYGMPCSFGAGKKPIAMCAFPEGSPGATALALVDGESSRIRIFHNARIQVRDNDEQALATGVTPAAIEIADVNNDHHDDIILTNRASKSISLYLNRGDGSFDGQISLVIEGTPSGFRYVQRSDSSGIFLTRDEPGDAIVATDWNNRTMSHHSVAYPTQWPVEILSSEFNSAGDSSGGGLRVLGLERKGEGQLGTIVDLEEIAPARFVEHAVTPPFPSSLITARVEQMHPKSYPSLLGITYDAARRKESFFDARGIGPWVFDTLRAGISFDDSDGAGATIWMADVDGDLIPDIIINRRSPVNELLVALGSRDTTFTQVHFRCKNAISISSPSNLRITDLSGDGVADMILLNDLKKEIQLYIGKGDGTFWPALRVASAEGIGGFAIGGLNDDIVPELYMTDTANNLLKIISFHAR